MNKKPNHQKALMYKLELALYLNFVGPLCHNNLYSHTLETGFESLNDWSLFHSLDEVRSWFLEHRENEEMWIEDIPLNNTKGWITDPITGNVSHESGDFFTIHGIRIHTDKREVGKGGWDQPILEQVGFDGGILGLIRKRFDGVPHYLCEIKVEPGNYGKVQISPTLQATFANLNKSHGGSKPAYAELFESDYPQGTTVLFDAWLAEDGGRLHLKRNRGILLEVDETVTLESSNSNNIWLSLYQIKSLYVEDAWINPHIRGILAHV